MPIGPGPTTGPSVMGVLLSFPHFSTVQPDEWPWLNFTPAEMACKEDGTLEIHTDFMDKLQAVRTALAHPMVITSGFRTPEYNRKVSKTSYDGPHTTGRACDIKVYGPRMLEILALALEHGFTGIGLKQKGPLHLRFIHLDDLDKALGRPRPWCWTY